MNFTNILTGIYRWIPTGKLQTRQRLCGGSGSPAKRFGQGEQQQQQLQQQATKRLIS